MESKLIECKAKIKKMKRKRKIIKIIYATTIVLSISASIIVAAVTFSLPPVVITTLSSVGALAAAISVKFNLENKKDELNNMISRLERLKQETNYVITCNGNLTEEESNRIIKEFI